ncbi:MAG: FlgB family protein [Pseudomonadota bacterium]
MDLNLEILRAARGLAAYATARHAVIAENVAHADTPGYRARDLTDFSDSFRSRGDLPFAMKATREGHIVTSPPRHSADVVERALFGAEAPNGNNVSIEDQMMRAVESQRQHSMALAVYRKSLDIIRTTLARP